MVTGAFQSSEEERLLGKGARGQRIDRGKAEALITETLSLLIFSGETVYNSLSNKYSFPKAALLPRALCSEI